MRLLIETDEGEVIEVVDDLEDWDLRKPAAQGHIIWDIVRIVEEELDIHA